MRINDAITRIFPNFAPRKHHSNTKTNMKERLFVFTMLCSAIGASAQNITQDMLDRFAKQNTLSGTERAVKNALAAGPVSVMALNQDNQVEQDTYFSNSVPSKGITD